MKYRPEAGDYFFGGATIALLVASFFICCGCATTIKLAIPPAQKVEIEPGAYVVDGKRNSVPYDATYSFENGLLIPHTSGFKLEPILGADLIGLQASPWAGLRTLHVENLGLDFGFNKTGFTLGLDWLYHDIVMGAGPFFPYDLGPSSFEVHAGPMF